MRTPAIVLNMKTYPQSLGKGCYDILRACEEVSEETGVEIAVCPPMVELSRVASVSRIPVLSQSVDATPPGSSTGWTPLESLSAADVEGSLLNHSEHRLEVADIGALVERMKAAGMTSIVCTNDETVSAACAVFRPTFVAVEPPELIGGDVSVTSANPEVVERSVRVVKDISPRTGVLTGAGVKNGGDAAKALELGCDGVLLASGVVKARDPGAALRDLASGF